MGRKGIEVVVSELEREQLPSMSRSRSLPHSLVRRAKIVLMAAGGHICWVTKVSIRAIDKLPPKEKEVLLVTTFHQLATTAAKVFPRPVAPTPAPKAAPASVKRL